METKKCVICKKIFRGFGNNPSPIKQAGICCNECNYLVIKERIRLSLSKCQTEKHKD